MRFRWLAPWNRNKSVDARRQRGLRQEVLEAISDADRVVAGGEGELLAVRAVGGNKLLVVVDREVSREDGFVVTSFLTSRSAWLERRRQVWPPKT